MGSSCCGGCTGHGKGTNAARAQSAVPHRQKNARPLCEGRGMLGVLSECEPILHAHQFAEILRYLLKITDFSSSANERVLADLYDAPEIRKPCKVAIRTCLDKVCGCV